MPWLESPQVRIAALPACIPLPCWLPISNLLICEEHSLNLLNKTTLQHVLLTFACSDSIDCVLQQTPTLAYPDAFLACPPCTQSAEIPGSSNLCMMKIVAQLPALRPSCFCIFLVKQNTHTSPTHALLEQRFHQTCRASARDHAYTVIACTWLLYLSITIACT